MTALVDQLHALLSNGSLSLVESFDQPQRAERRLPVPQPYLDGPLGDWLKGSVAADGHLWRHQSLAFESVLRGENVVVSTGTASGKSLIFQTAILHELLATGGTALILYPLKALLSDQLARWRALAAQVGLSNANVAELHGQVPPDERHLAVRNASIVVATPDVIQAWLMRNISTPAVRSFLAELRFLVLDEAHVYESVFGSNVAYLIRRFLAARKRICDAKQTCANLQIIASTATIYDAVDHLDCLTGWPFTEVTERDDGSPSFKRELLHIEGPEGAGAEGAVVDIINSLDLMTADGSFIVFHDSRQGVERIASIIDNDAILPYRSGYEAEDKRRIERALRSGHLRGVISTSALELGIDVAAFTLGINLGVPSTKKAFRQRLGRVGRASPGMFAVVAPRQAFTRYGSTFEEYYEGSVEPSYLYLDNRFIQFAQARCLIDESEALEAPVKRPPPDVSWPETFYEIFDLARPGVRKPREFDFIAQLGADNPHINYPLRQVGEPNYQLREGSGAHSETIGDIALNQAIREAYPGATYLHLRKPKWVREWRSTSYERSIRLQPSKRPIPTRPLLRKTINVSLGSEDLIASQILTGPTGSLAEVNLQVNESVEGFRLPGKTLLYRDLRANDPRMTRKQRDFRTTGVIIKIDEPWFAGGSGQPALNRAAVAEALKELLIRERSISPNDVDSSSTNIVFYESGVPKRAVDTVAVYDSIYGGLRLAESLFTEFGEYLERLSRAAGMAGTGAFIGSDLLDKLVDWFGTLSVGNRQREKAISVEEGELVIFAPGSIVAILHNGMLVERELVQPRLFDLGSAKMLMYKYLGPEDGECLVPHDQIQATGVDWRYAIWNPATGQIREIEDEEDGGGFF